jgi:hypothetical protein
MIELIETPIPPDMEVAAENIVEGVRNGMIVGLGIVVVLKGRRFFVDAFGTLLREPHSGRGYVASLDDFLHDLGSHQRDRSTTI